MRAMDIEALLWWAYREELPKKACLPRTVGLVRSGWSRTEQAARLGAIVDEPNVYGCIPAGLLIEEEPHPDAILVHEAVMGLDAIELVMPEAWSPADDLADLGLLVQAAVIKALGRLTTIDRAGRRVLREPLSVLMRRHAILGDAPDWRVDETEERLVTEYGKPKWFVRETLVVDGQTIEVERDGYDQRRQRPRVGAYRKYFLDPDPTAALASRGEYEVWRAALDVLAEDLAGRLTTIEVRPSGRTWRPWVEGEAAGPRILMARGAAPTIEPVTRPTAGTRLGKWRG